jgi:phosphohistidine phosphatase
VATVLLVRHGIAEPWRPGHPDANRALTPEGWVKTRAAMRGLAALGHRPTQGLSSPYLRAMETLVCLKEAVLALDPGADFPVESWAGLAPDGDPAAAEAWLRHRLLQDGGDACVAVTSHEPFLSLLIARLTGRQVDVKKASCTVVAWTGERWRFVDHHSPSELRGT